MNRVALAALFAAFVAPFAAYAIDAPCAAIHVTAREVTVHVRVYSGNTIRPATYIAPDGKKHTGSWVLKFTGDANRFRLEPGPRYEEVRIVTANETPAPLRAPRCVDVVLSK